MYVPVAIIVVASDTYPSREVIKMLNTQYMRKWPAMLAKYYNTYVNGNPASHDNKAELYNKLAAKS